MDGTTRYILDRIDKGFADTHAQFAGVHQGIADLKMDVAVLKAHKLNRGNPWKRLTTFIGGVLVFFHKGNHL